MTANPTLREDHRAFLRRYGRRKETAVGEVLFVAGDTSYEFTVEVLREALALPPEKLRPYKQGITALPASGSDAVREQVVGALATPGWIDVEEATALAEEALRDDDAAVSDRSFDTLRTLREGA